MSNTTQCVLLSGSHNYVDSDGNRVTAHAGDVVPLTADQFESFKDRFKDAAEVEEENELAAKRLNKAKAAKQAKSAKPAAAKSA